MKIFKITDVCISLAMLIVFSFRFATEDRLNWLFESYFIIGGWQSISMLIHAMNNWHTRKWGTRYIYHRIAFVGVVTLPVGSCWILAFTAPFMAMFYTGLCFFEIRKYEVRPAELLGK
jgi:hypothetical protein